MKNYDKLTVSDFVIEETSWGKRCSAKVGCHGRSVTIQLPGLEFATTEIVTLCKSALRSWQKEGKSISRLTEEYFEMPDLKLAPEDRALWSLQINEITGYPAPTVEKGKPCSLTFLYDLTGGCLETHPNLEDTTIELTYNVTNFTIDWNNPTLDSTTDLA
ncbi:MAG: hypothetical protein CMJ46_11525 [Planctomyces sp.]|nr:hypothetical protein [Planctomyces sp.]